MICFSFFRDALDTIMKYTAGIGYDEFVNNKLLQDAIIREIEIIGEAARNLSEETKSKYPDIPWKKIIGMRNRLIHHYFGIEFDSDWKTVVEDVPKLRSRVEDILNSMES